jgi:hypothetical protein
MVMLSGHDSAATSLGNSLAASVHVAAGRTPPLAHLLLRDARAARYVDDLRRVVIDAATACEVALSESIRERLNASLPTEEVEPMIDRRRGGLMELYNFHVAAVAPIAVRWGTVAGHLAGRGTAWPTPDTVPPTTRPRSPST